MPLPFTSTLVQTLQARLEPTVVEPLVRLQSNGRLLSLPTNIRLRCKYLAVENTLGYYDTAIVSFIVQTPSKNVIDSDKYCTYLGYLGR